MPASAPYFAHNEPHGRPPYDENSTTVAEAQAAQRAAETLVRVKSEFLSLAAHDLSQPVQSLELVINAIGNALVVPAECGSRMAEISRLSAQANAALARMRELVRMLLEIARLESGTACVHAKPVSVSEIFSYLERQFAPLAGARALAFETESSDHLIDTDPTLLRGMLANLLANALRYTQRGEVRLESAPAADGRLHLLVRDTGIGIPQSELASIFEDFRRLDEAERLTSEGFGLGLGLVRRLSSLLGFPVHVESAVGRGSTFAIEIPPAKVLCLA
jgi:signal transduction histidine kinase